MADGVEGIARLGGGSGRDPGKGQHPRGDGGNGRAPAEGSPAWHQRRHRDQLPNDRQLGGYVLLKGAQQGVRGIVVLLLVTPHHGAADEQRPAQPLQQGLVGSDRAEVDSGDGDAVGVAHRPASLASKRSRASARCWATRTAPGDIPIVAPVSSADSPATTRSMSSSRC